MIEVMYNGCHGGFGFSQKAMDQYHYLKRSANPYYIDINMRDIERTDPLMISIVKTLGHEANGRSSKIVIEEIPKKYQIFYHIDEYDGQEDIHIDYQTYKLCAIKLIVESDSHNKINEIKDILDLANE